MESSLSWVNRCKSFLLVPEKLHKWSDVFPQSDIILMISLSSSPETGRLFSLSSACTFSSSLSSSVHLSRCSWRVSFNLSGVVLETGAFGFAGVRNLFFFRFVSFVLSTSREWQLAQGLSVPSSRQSMCRRNSSWLKGLVQYSSSSSLSWNSGSIFFGTTCLTKCPSNPCVPGHRSRLSHVESNDEIVIWRTVRRFSL